MLGAVEGNNSINSVKFFNATSAFKANPSKVEQTDLEPIKESGVEVRENSILRNIDVEEIKKYASSVGENGLTEEDIKYGLKFGRSVLINYSA